MRKKLSPTQRHKRAVISGRKGGKAKVPKGFALMTPERRREVQVKGRLSHIFKKVQK